MLHFFFPRWVFVLALLVLPGMEVWAKSPAGYKPVSGDVIFQSFPHNPLTDLIESATESTYSHCGLVVVRPGGAVVLEAIGPVTETPLEQWIARGRDGAFAVYRLRHEYAGRVGEIIQAANRFRGRPYDSRYRFDDEKIYCSELVFKAFQKVTGEELGVVRKLAEFNWKPNEAAIRRLEGGGLPLERKMISPKDLAAARQLRLVLDAAL